MPDLELRDVSREDLPGVIGVRTRSFGPMPPGGRDEWLRTAGEFCDEHRFLGMFDGATPVAAARIWDFRQWWYGSPVPMGGVAGVVVAPEHRGRGVGSTLMRGVLERSQELGHALSALYPATLPLYRHLGYEVAGGRYRFSFPARSLRGLGGHDVRLRAGGPDDTARLFELVAGVRSEGRESGLLGWPADEVRKWLGEENTFCYLADDGFVVYEWEGSDLTVSELVAGSEATARALWATVGSGSSVARTVHAYVSPQDPIHLMLDDEAEVGVRLQRWMLRLLDPAAAFAGRGWPPGVEVDVALELDDWEVPDSSGSWRMRVSGGTGQLVRATSRTGGLRLSARGLAALYAGTPVATLRRAGVTEGGTAEGDAALDAAFGGPTPYMLDYF